jgi:hypothetical protein
MFRCVADILCLILVQYMGSGWACAIFRQSSCGIGCINAEFATPFDTLPPIESLAIWTNARCSAGSLTRAVVPPRPVTDAISRPEASVAKQ